MTFPRVYKPGLPKTFDNVDREATKLRMNRPVPLEPEITETLRDADKIENEYFRLRAKAIIALGVIFGKRRVELRLLEMEDIKIEGDYLYLVFTIAKKHKRGFHQYLKFLRKQGDPQLLNKPLPELEAEWREWTKTELGYRVKKDKKPKGTPLSDKYAKIVLEYYEFVREKYPESKFLFPSGKDVFGSYMIYPDKALSGRQMLAIVSELNPDLWLHLLRKKKGSEVARKYGRTLESVFMVKETLDLEREETAYKYIEEFVPKIETGEQPKAER
jgi:integrase